MLTFFIDYIIIDTSVKLATSTKLATSDTANY